ncbi:hypothetical protein LCGC14_1179510 [marine sediment metagenome]|uniref:Uncharacterized protein n=1 Tax=marine sediment metagenome TaxID=412755 RepID=A0A0F9P5K6_9ZZZZ
MMHASGGMHLHEARRLLRHEPRELRPLQLFAEQSRTVGGGPVQLKYVLCKVDADDANFFHGCLLSCAFNTASVAHCGAVRGKRHPPHLHLGKLIAERSEGDIL